MTGDGSITAPYATLGRAKTAMEAGGPQITYVRAGTYFPPSTSYVQTFGTVTRALYLTAADSGQTYSYYPPDGYDSAILDGGSTSASTGIEEMIAIDGGSNITINGLQIQHFRWFGIGSHGGEHFYEPFPNSSGVSSGNTITNNIVHDGGYDTSIVFGYGVAAITNEENIPNLTITNNVVYNDPAHGILSEAGNKGSGGSINNLLYQNNVVLNTCTAVDDCSALYAQDTNATSTNIRMIDNFVRDAGFSSGPATGHAINLDDGTSNVTVTGNILTGRFLYAFGIHGGKNDTYDHNIVDLGSDGQQAIGYYQNSLDTTNTPLTAMTGNSFTGNIITSDGGGGGWQGACTPGCAGYGAQPTIASNVYYNYAGSPINHNGINGLNNDTNPINENPQLSCWTYTLAGGTPLFSPPVSFATITHTWGPPGYTIPDTGTPPSQPHNC